MDKNSLHFHVSMYKLYIRFITHVYVVITHLYVVITHMYVVIR